MHRQQRQSGFSLIEVVITIGILMSLTIAVASMLRSGFEVKAGLSARSRMLHRLSIASTKISDDLQHTFYVQPKDAARGGSDRAVKTILKVEKNGEFDKLSLTTRTHRPMLAGAHEADVTYVVYELRDSKDIPGRRNLYRGESTVPPEDLKITPPMKLLATNIKSLSVQFWNGEKFDIWDTERPDYRNRLPHLAKITIEAWKEDRDPGDVATDESIDAATDKINTVVYLSGSTEYDDIKPPGASIRWGEL